MSVRQNCGNPPESPNMRWRAGAPTDQSGVSQKKKKHKNFRRRNASSWAPAGSVVGDREESKVRLNFRKYWSGVSPNSRLRANCRTVIPALKSRNLQFRCVSGSSFEIFSMTLSHQLDPEPCTAEAKGKPKKRQERQKSSHRRVANCLVACTFARQSWSSHISRVSSCRLEVASAGGRGRQSSVGKG